MEFKSFQFLFFILIIIFRINTLFPDFLTIRMNIDILQINKIH